LARSDRNDPRFQRTTAVAKASERPKGGNACSVVVIAGPELGRQLSLDDDSVEIGRLPECALQMDVESVSRRHARIERTDSGYKVVDLGSTNGTMVNGVRIKEHVLRDGDHIKTGKVVIKFIAGDNIEVKYHQELNERAQLDPLTGVANRRHFEDALKRQLTKAAFSAAPFSLIAFDLDHFKRINDGHGHPAGDWVLKMVAELVVGEVRSEDMVARTGGEEFAVLLPSAPRELAMSIAERIRRAIETEPFEFEKRRIVVTVSLGVATFELGQDRDAAAIYKRADEKLYEAKQSGRNRVCD
jgi:two-component system, cell cycle response regulator